MLFVYMCTCVYGNVLQASQPLMIRCSVMCLSVCCSRSGQSGVTDLLQQALGANSVLANHARTAIFSPGSSPNVHAPRGAQLTHGSGGRGTHGPAVKREKEDALEHVMASARTGQLAEVRVCIWCCALGFALFTKPDASVGGGLRPLEDKGQLQCRQCISTMHI